MSFRRRTYSEIVDNFLTSITGGVAGEVFSFPPDGDPLAHDLARPAASEVVSVWGRRDGGPNRFRRDVDFELSGDGRRVVWLAKKATQLPDRGTLIDVNYRPHDAGADLTDVHTGSVVRTLVESTALEIARLYAQLDVVYRSGFVDTAEGRALDSVTALLGIDRVKAGPPVGEIEFARSATSRGAVTIPSGTRVTTEDGSIEYETTQEGRLDPGQARVLVPSRDLEFNEELPAGSLVVLPAPIEGIGAVSNPSATSVSTEAETDVELRTRARNFLHGSERATLSALREAVRRQGVQAKVVEVAGSPGVIRITPQVQALPAELKLRLERAVEDARPAGIVVLWAGNVQPSRIDLELSLATTPGLLEADLRAAQHQVGDALTALFGSAETGQDVSMNRLVGAVMGVDGVDDVEIRSVNRTEGSGAPVDALDRAAGVIRVAGKPFELGEVILSDPALPVRLAAVVRFTAGSTAPDPEALRSALGAAAAAFNSINQTPAADATAKARRQVSWRKLAAVLPLPGRTAADATSVFPVDATVTLPAGLSTLAEGDLLPYTVRFVLTPETGPSANLETTETTWDASPGDRVALGEVTVQELGDG